MGDLRRQETQMRDWLIQELQLSRGRQDANENARRISEQNLIDCEHQFMYVAGSTDLF